VEAAQRARLLGQTADVSSCDGRHEMSSTSPQAASPSGPAIHSSTECFIPAITFTMAIPIALASCKLMWAWA
jgi:hypothetical protein